MELRICSKARPAANIAKELMNGISKYGGAVHFCGRGDHYIEMLCSLPGLYAVQMSQPELNDMEIIYKNTVDKGIKLLAFNKKTAEGHLSRPGGFWHNLNV